MQFNKSPAEQPTSQAPHSMSVFLAVSNTTKASVTEAIDRLSLAMKILLA
jgi:hypothetical protein